MGKSKYPLAERFLAGAGVREFGSEGLPCDKKCEDGDNRWRNSSKEDQEQVLQLLQIVLSFPLTKDCVTYLPVPSPLGWTRIILDEQEQKLFTYLLKDGRKRPYGDDLMIYLAAYTERRRDKNAIFFSHHDLSQSQASCWASFSLIRLIPKVWLWYLRSDFFS